MEASGRNCRTLAALAARGDVLVNVEREVGNFAAGWRGVERTSLAIEGCAGFSAELC